MTHLLSPSCFFQLLTSMCWSWWGQCWIPLHTRLLPGSPTLHLKAHPAVAPGDLQKSMGNLQSPCLCIAVSLSSCARNGLNPGSGISVFGASRNEKYHRLCKHPHGGLPAASLAQPSPTCPWLASRGTNCPPPMYFPAFV